METKIERNILIILLAFYLTIFAAYYAKIINLAIKIFGKK